MKPTSLLNALPGPLRRHPVITTLLLLALLAAGAWLLRPTGNKIVDTAFHEVRRGDFTISVVEGGTLAAVSEVAVRNEVEGTARIVWIVPEGSYVKKGDLLVELDSAQAQDQLNQQQINFEKAKFAVEQAQATLEIQRSSTNSDFLAADLKVRFAKIDRDKYREGQMMVDLIEASNRVVQSEAQLAVNSETFMHSTNLAAKGYETRSRVDSDRLAVLNTHNSLIVATNTLWMLQRFDVQKQLEKLDADILQAEQELMRVVSQNKRKMAQFEADLETQQRTLALSEEKLDRDRKNLEATKIYAPQEGLVVYQMSDNRWSSESLVEGGAIVRNRQELIKLPDLSRMKITVKVHESHVTMIRPGMIAFVILDSMPDLRFRGVVEKVAPLPDSQSRWGNPNLKVYNTDIYLTDTVPNVKPGVSAKAEIIVTNMSNALSVPIQAVTSLKGKQVAYVLRRGDPTPEPVEVGLFNTKFIEITKGLDAGDRVLLSPPFDTQSKDLGGAVLTAEERAAAAATNNPVPPRTPAETPGEPGSGSRVGPLAGGPAQGADASADPSARNGNRRSSPTMEEIRKQYDKNGDGELDDTEREAMRVAMAERATLVGGGTNGPGGPSRFSPEEMLKRFDKNGDGQIDDDERAAIRDTLGGSRRGPRGNRGPGDAGSGGIPAGNTGSGGGPAVSPGPTSAPAAP